MRLAIWMAVLAATLYTHAYLHEYVHEEIWETFGCEDTRIEYQYGFPIYAWCHDDQHIKQEDWPIVKQTHMQHHIFSHGILTTIFLVWAAAYYIKR